MYNLTEDEQNVITEQRFPHEGLTREERDYYLNIIRNCKDISDSNHKVDGEGKCEIVQLYFKKTDGQININGTLFIGSKTKEGRCITGYISISDNSILVDMNIIRLGVENPFREYSVIDEFKIIKGNLVRNSFYNYDMKKITKKIDNEEMKGKLK